MISKHNLILNSDLIIEIKRLDNENFLLAYAMDKKIDRKTMSDYLRALDGAIPEVKAWLTDKLKEVAEV